MNKTTIGMATCIAFLATACARESSSVDVNLECAATISAATQLSMRGALDTDAEFDSKALFSSMMHLNTYAIPSGLREAEAFEQANGLRDSMIETQTPSKLLSRAKSCIRNTPGA